jgi:Ca2+-binding RTX toxin-like protein
LNSDPDFVSRHVFSTADILGTFSGVTQGDVAPGDTPVIDFTATPKVTKDGVSLYPINSEFGFIVTDFEGAEQKDFDANPEYAEGWAGDLTINGEHIGLVVSDSPTDTFKTPAVLGTWLSGLGGNSVKASTEHYSVMQAVLSDQLYPGDGAAYPLDDALRVIGGTYDGQLVSDVIGIVGDVNGDGVADIRDVLEPNETTIDSNIAASTDYSVTLKDDGKLLYRWGNMIKKPNDVRIEAELDLPDEWNEPDLDSDGLTPLFRVTSAELVVHHTITNNPNDQIRPEDYENEAAIGQLPEYEILPDGKWVTVADYYAGDGTLYPAGTVLKDPALAQAWEGSALDQIGAMSEDLKEGFTNAWYTTMNRAPFEADLNDDGTAYDTGPRWRLKPDKYGQDLPGVVIPLDPSDPPPTQNGEEKYVVGAETQTVINLLDWGNDISPLSISAGWQSEPGSVTENGLNKTHNFDLSIYVKGDIKPATLYSAELLLDYEEIPIFDQFASITGGVESDYLVGQGGNTFNGGAGSDLFVVSYGAKGPGDIVASVVDDFEVGADKIGFIDLGVTDDTFDGLVSQSVVGGNLEISIDGALAVTLTGITEALDMETDFFLAEPDYGTIEPVFGTEGNDVLEGTEGPDVIAALGGDDYVLAFGGDDAASGGDGNDVIDGGDGDDTLDGGAGNDVLVGAAGDDLIVGGDGDDAIDAGEGADIVVGDAGADQIFGGGGDDFLFGANASVDSVDDDWMFGGDGNDLLVGGGGADFMIGDAGMDTMAGGDGNDTIGGSDGDDVIDGGAGEDMIMGGVGADLLVGGSDADVFAFVATNEGGDTIADFQSGTDKIFLSDAFGLTSGMGVSAGEFYSGAGLPFFVPVFSQAVLFFDSANSDLYYDADGGLTSNATLLADLNGALLTADDFMIA